MAETSVLLAGIEYKIRKLIDANTRMTERLADLERENHDLRQKVLNLVESNTELTDHLNKKIIVNALGNGQEIEEGRKLIKALLREIDQCVALLNK